MDSSLSGEMITEILSRTSLKALDTVRCTSNELYNLTYASYFLDLYKKRNKIVLGCLLQNMKQGGISYIKEFVASPDSNNLDLKFLPSDANILACSEQGIMVFASPNPRLNMRDLYHVCKPATKQVLPLPNPKTKYTTLKVAINVVSMAPLHYKIVRLSEPKCSVLQTKDKKLYHTYNVEHFNSKKWAWSSPDLVILPQSVFLTNPQPITTRGFIYMLLTNGHILRVDAYSEKWEIFSPPVPALEFDESLTSKQLVKYQGKLGFAYKPPNGSWEIWVLNFDKSWEKAYIFNMKEDTGHKSIKTALYGAATRAMADHGTIVSYMFNECKTDHSSQIFNFRSDFEPIDLIADKR